MPSSSASPVTDWKIGQLGDLTGKRYLITGANAGIGYEAAVHLRRANADVIVAARSATKGADAAKSLTNVDGGGTVRWGLVYLKGEPPSRTKVMTTCIKRTIRA